MDMSTVALRPVSRIKPGDILDPTPGYGGPTKIYHPKSKEMRMFMLPNLEYDEKSQRFGIHHALALWAAQIIACNTPGFLSTEQNAASDPKYPLDAILLAGRYFFHPMDGSSEYGICNSLLSWGFPHKGVPAEWRAALPKFPFIVASDNIEDRIYTRDASQCRVSEFNEGTKIAHLIPYARKEEEWFKLNWMWGYSISGHTSSALQIHNDENLLLLRRDLCHLFDKGIWAFVPRNGSLAVSYMHHARDSLLHYHGRATLPLHTCPEYLYARFAWAVLRYMKPVSIRGVPVKIWDIYKSEWREKQEGDPSDSDSSDEDPEDAEGLRFTRQ